MPTAKDVFSQRLAQALKRVNGTDPVKILPAAAPPPDAAGMPATPSPVATAAPGPGAANRLAPPEQARAEANDAADTPTVGNGDHVVKAGECIASIAKQTGHFWQTLWDEPGNADLKSTRRLPNVLMAGDRVLVPALRPKVEQGVTEMRHRFVRRGEPSHFAARILDQDVPRGNEPFTLVIDEKQTITGMTDPEGKIDVPIPGNARQGVLTVGVEPDTLKMTINFGGLDPVESWSGVQTRLKNLGFACNPGGACDDQTLDALNEFRESVGLPRGDTLDDATRGKLQEKHGS